MHIDIGGFIGGAVNGVVMGLVLPAVVLALIAALKPEQLIIWLYGILDFLVEMLDDRIVDRISNSKIKVVVQEKINGALEKSKEGITALQAKIND